MSGTQPAFPAYFQAGIVEGFFGRAWSWPDRRDFAGFLTDTVFSAYLYAPKSDHYLRRDWAKPFPVTHKRQLTQVCRTYLDRQLDFGIGLSPFELYRNFNAENRRLLKHKLEALNAIGPSSLCILFDDMPGDFADLARKQSDIMHFVMEHSTARDFALCPTYYSFDPLLRKQFGSEPEGYLEQLGQWLDAQVRIFWTGPKVISQDYSAAHLQEVSALLQRKPLIWDNYPVNDGKALVPFLHLRPGNRSLPDVLANSSGHFANPMNQAWLSRIPLLATSLQYQGEQDPGKALETSVLGQCGDTLGRLILEDCSDFQDQGLETFSGSRIEALTARYTPHRDNPFAREILDWLQGEYAFDPACLT